MNETVHGGFFASILACPKFSFERNEQFRLNRSLSLYEQERRFQIMKRLIEAVMQRSTIILICVVLILAFGAVSAVQMQRDYLPGINNTTLMVSLRASSYQADQVKRDLTTPLEDVIRKTNGI